MVNGTCSLRFNILSPRPVMFLTSQSIFQRAHIGSLPNFDHALGNLLPVLLLLRGQPNYPGEQKISSDIATGLHTDVPRSLLS